MIEKGGNTKEKFETLSKMRAVQAELKEQTIQKIKSEPSRKTENVRKLFMAALS